jgi:glycerol-3-phosphate acyltransferase PlsX
MLPVAIDLMSGDHGATSAVAAALLALERFPALHIIAVGTPDVLAALPAHPRLQSQAASEVVGMNELPSKVLRQKKDSSLRVAINLVKAGRASAAVSAGNTGALMATAKFVLKTLPHIDRPAIIAPLPAHKGRTYVLDLGANSECEAAQLLQFATLGSALVSVLDGIERPKIGLLNLGEEDIKGGDTLQTAAQLLSQSGLNYTGFIEGDGIFWGEADVVVCDGFVGNVALKASEGVAKLIRHYLREAFTQNWLTKAAALLVKPILNTLAERLDPRNYNGAVFVGLNGLVVKSHGSADALSFANAIGVAVRAVERDLVGKTASLLERTNPS